MGMESWGWLSDLAVPAWIVLGLIFALMANWSRRAKILWSVLTIAVAGLAWWGTSSQSATQRVLKEQLKTANRTLDELKQNLADVRKDTSESFEGLGKKLREVPTATLEPMIDLAIGEPFGNATLIGIRNSGTVPVVSVAANVRCFLLKEPQDLSPVLFFEGFPSIGNTHSWWIIPALNPGTTETKDAKESLARCLYNREVWERSMSRPIVAAVISIDLVYDRQVDHKRYTLSGIATLIKDTVGKPFLWPLQMTDFYRRLLDTVTAPSYRATSGLLYDPSSSSRLPSLARRRVAGAGL